MLVWRVLWLSPSSARLIIVISTGGNTQKWYFLPFIWTLKIKLLMSSFQVSRQHMFDSKVKASANCSNFCLFNSCRSEILVKCHGFPPKLIYFSFEAEFEFKWKISHNAQSKSLWLKLMGEFTAENNEKSSRNNKLFALRSHEFLNRRGAQSFRKQVMKSSLNISFVSRQVNLKVAFV